MDKSGPRSKDAYFSQGRPARKSREVQPASKSEPALETYEQSPERPGTDERNNHVAGDGSRVPDPERGSPD